MTIRSDESEGTIALGGDLHLQSGYNVAAGAPPEFPTYTAPGDARPVYLHVGGGISWDAPGVGANVENGGFTKVADTGTYTAYDTDDNGAAVNYRLVPRGRPYNTTPHIDGRVSQTPASIGTPVDPGQVDFAGAFSLYRDLTQQMARCPATVGLRDDQGSLLPQPFPAGTRGRLTLERGETNVLSLSAADLVDLSEITFVNRPTADTPLLVNVSGSSYNGNVPNLAGIGGAQAPYILWNFPDATSVRVAGGDSIEGTLYAPNATLTWVPTSNIEGNVIARNFNHGTPTRSGPQTREIHDFPFDTTLSCAERPGEPPRLTLIKRVVNDNGGTAEPDDWTLSADGPTNVEGRTGRSETTGNEIISGNYVLSEDGPPGYSSSGWTCDGGELTDGDRLHVSAGDDITCIIINRDRPGRLTLVKKVINDHGGTATPGDWTLSASGPTDITGRSGGPRVTRAQVDRGEYTLRESDGPDGYRSLGWRCTGARVTDRNTVTIRLGAHVVCTVTNDDRPGAAPEVPGTGTGGGGSGTGSGFGGSTDSTGGAAADGTGSLPAAGSTISPWLPGLAALLVLTGGGLVVASRRRRDAGRRRRC